MNFSKQFTTAPKKLEKFTFLLYWLLNDWNYISSLYFNKLSRNNLVFWCLSWCQSKSPIYLWRLATILKKHKLYPNLDFDQSLRKSEQCCKSSQLHLSRSTTATTSPPTQKGRTSLPFCQFPSLIYNNRLSVKIMAWKVNK